MALDLEKLGVPMRLSDLQEHLVKEQTAMQEAAKRMRDMVDPLYLRKLREDQQRMRDLIDPSYLREMREAQERIRDMVDPPGLRQWRDDVASMGDLTAETISGMRPLVDMFGIEAAKNFAARHLLEMPTDHLAGLKELMSAQSLSSSIANSFMIRDAELAALSRSAALFKTIEIPDYAKEFHQLSKISAAAEAMLETLDASRGFADLLGVHDVTRSLVEYQTGRLNLAYAGFSESMVNRPEWIISAPDFVRTAPSDIIFTQARAVRVITTHEDVEEESAVAEIWAGVQERTLGYIEAVLPEVSPRLMKSWEGVWDAARRRGPDWARHAGSSLRFILIEVLDTVAPIDALGDIPKQYYRDGKIMRPGQIYWLCVPLNNRTYRRVARADLESAISIIDAMSEAVHRDDYIEIEDAFDTMAVRASIALCNLLKLWRTRH